MHKGWCLGCYLSCCIGLILATPAFGQRYLNSSTDSVEVLQDTAADLNATVTGTLTCNAGSGTFNVQEPLSVDDNASSLTVDGTVTANAGTGTFDVDVVANSIGLATSANQLADGHNVTVDNAAGAAAVNIQDGGNSITVDGAVTASGTVSSEKTASTSVVDANNSSTSALGGGAAFTGTGTDVLDYACITFTAATDQDSATDGMTIQFSPDNSNWDDVYSWSFLTATDSARRFQFPVTNQYMRIVFTNGATPQGYFRLQTILHPDNCLTSIHRIGDTITADRSAQLMKSTVTGQDALAGTFKNVKTYDAAGSFTSLLTLGVDADAHILDVTNAGEIRGHTCSTDNTEANARYALCDASGHYTVDLDDLNGAALAANQLADGHNVTVDNGAGGAAVNIQDGGNTITVDGTVSVNDPVEVDGPVAAGVAISGNPIPVGARDLAGQIEYPACADVGAGICVLAASPYDYQLNPIDYTAAGESYAFIAGTAASKATAVYLDTDASSHLEVVGPEAHDAAVASAPFQCGGVATDYEPDAEGEQGPTEVNADNDIARVTTNRRGQIIEGVNKMYDLMTELDDPGIDDTTEHKSNDYETWNYRTCRFSYCLDESLGNPTRMTFKIYGSSDSTVEYEYREGMLSTWMHEDQEVANEVCFSYPFQVHHRYTIVSYQCTGCDASNEFALDDSELACSN